MKKGVISFLVSSILIISCSQIQRTSSNTDCSTLIKHNALQTFAVEDILMDTERAQKYLLDEEKYYGKCLELKTEETNDTLVVRHYRIGGNSSISCVGFEYMENAIHIVNYESNYIKEVCFREFEYRIPNPYGLKLGAIEFKALEK